MGHGGDGSPADGWLRVRPLAELGEATGQRAHGAGGFMSTATTGHGTFLSRNELAIARSVIYASLFEYPLTLDQLRRALVESDQTEAEIFSTFCSSEQLPVIIEYRDGFFFPAGQRELIARRREREARSHAFLERHRRLGQAHPAAGDQRLVHDRRLPPRHR